MYKTIPVSPELHMKIKIQAVNKGLKLGEYLAEVVESQARLASMALDLNGMSKDDLYRLVADDKVIVLKCEDVFEFEN